MRGYGLESVAVTPTTIACGRCRAMSRPIVVFNCARNYEPGSIEHDCPRMVSACEIRLTEAKDGPELAAVLADADVLIARRDYVGPATLELTRNLKGIVTPGVGVEK